MEKTNLSIFNRDVSRRSALHYLAFSHDVEAIICYKDLVDKRFPGSWEGLIKGEDNQGI